MTAAVTRDEEEEGGVLEIVKQPPPKRKLPKYASGDKRKHFSPCLSVRTLSESLDPVAQDRIRGSIARAHAERLVSFESLGDVEVKVAFTTVEIREYPLLPGDNPGARTGIPLALDWDYQAKALMKVDTYEERRKPRRAMVEMRVPADVRTKMLLDNGHSMASIVRATKPVNIARQQRNRSNELLPLDGFLEKKERVLRGTKNLIFRGKKKQEREFLKQGNSLSSKKKGDLSSTTIGTTLVDSNWEPLG